MRWSVCSGVVGMGASPLGRGRERDSVGMASDRALITASDP